MTLSKVTATSCAHTNVYRMNISIRGSSIGCTNLKIGRCNFIFAYLVNNSNGIHSSSSLHVIISACLINIDSYCANTHRTVDSFRCIF